MTNVLNVRTDSTWMRTIIVLILVPVLILLNQNAAGNQVGNVVKEKCINVIGL